MPPHLPPRALDALHAFAGKRAWGPDAERRQVARVRRSLSFLSQAHLVEQLPPETRAHLARMRTAKAIRPGEVLSFLDELRRYGFLSSKAHHDQAAGFHKVSVLMGWCKTYYPTMRKALARARSQERRRHWQGNMASFEEAVRPAVAVGPEADLERLESGFARVLGLSLAEFRERPTEALLERLVSKLREYLPDREAWEAKTFTVPGPRRLERALGARERDALVVSLKQLQFQQNLRAGLARLVSHVEAVTRTTGKAKRMKQLQNLYLEAFFEPGMRHLYNSLFPVPAKVPAELRGLWRGDILRDLGIGINEFKQTPEAVAATVRRLRAIDPATARARLRETRQAVWRMLQGDQQAYVIRHRQLGHLMGISVPEPHELPPETRARMTPPEAKKWEEAEAQRYEAATKVYMEQMTHMNTLRDAFYPLASAVKYNLALLEQELEKALRRRLP